METNHVIIFSDRMGREADELVDSGLLEGSSRSHPGQGTTNRKFYFRNIFFEIVWVENEDEVRSKRTAPAGLWERFCFRENGASPFGLCFSRTPDLDDFFSGSIQYRPEYIPEGTFFEIIPNIEQNFLPWTCRLPAIGKQSLSNEPMNHAQGMQTLTRIKIGINRPDLENKYASFLENSGSFEFYNARQHQMILEFDLHKQGRHIRFSSLPLIIAY